MYFNNYYLHSIPTDLKLYIDMSGVKIYPHIIKEINTYPLSKNVIGLHYRGTDNPFKLSIKDFINRANMKISDNTQVFICSDEKESEEMIQNHFKKNIVFPKASYVKQYDTNNSSFRYNCLRDETSCMEAFKECILLEKQQYLMMEQKAHSEI